MSRIRFLLLLLIVLIGALAFWLHQRSTAPPDVAFATVQQEKLVSTLVTNGKVEPSEWAAVRAERPGSVERVDVQKGQQVPRGALLVELDARDARAAVSSAEAALVEARAQLQTLSQGGAETARVEIENELERNRMELATAQREHASLQRLADKQAATGQDLRQAVERVRALQGAMQALERKRGALVGPADRAGAEARCSEASAALEQARAQLARSRIHAPVAGVVYELPVRVGAYLNVGDVAASVGNLLTLRVRIYVDEPELGRVAAGMPVAVTWDALPGRTWTGSVEKLPTQVAPLGTRQVGEVICTIENRDLKLLPGTNVNVEITSQVVANGLTIPKEAIRTENGQTGVYVLSGDRVEWRPVHLGAASVTRAAVVSGVARGDRIALRTDVPLHAGDRVREVQP
jgi:HlyD family secretion protein